ncbi:MAG: cytochrome P450 [Ignavibacteriales bacterium]|nr:cytochrome P450 [Ignavibacteriales bacterium]
MKKLKQIKGLQLLSLLPRMLYNLPDTLAELAQSGEGIMKIGFDKSNFIFISEPEYIKHILKTNVQNYSRGKSAMELKPILGNGIFISGENDWKRQRQAVSTAFHAKYFDDFYPIIIDELEIFGAVLETAVKTGGHVNFTYQLKKLAARISYRTMFINNPAIDVEVILPALDKVYDYVSFYRHSVREATKLVFGKETKLGTPRDIWAAFDLLHRFSVQIFETAEQGKAEPMVFLQTLLDASRQGGCSKEEAIDQVKNIVFAGYDTVGETFGWLWYCLAKYPEHVQKVREEVFSMCNGSAPLHDQLGNLPELLMFIKEVMRIYPVVWTFHRLTGEDDVIDGYQLHKGDWIMISPYVIHRNPAYWPNPLVFDPNRFAGDMNPVPVRFDYLPFGQGPHTCLGNRLGMFEMQLVVAALIQKYDFISTDAFPGIKSDILLRQRKPLMMKVVKR